MKGPDYPYTPLGNDNPRWLADNPIVKAVTAVFYAGTLFSGFYYLYKHQDPLSLPKPRPAHHPPPEVPPVRDPLSGLLPPDREKQVKGCWTTAAIDPDVRFEGVNTIFGYGSLIFKPDFDPKSIVQKYPSMIKGYKRRFWQSSNDHRGTENDPGLVATILKDSHPDLMSENLLSQTSDGSVVGMIYELRNLSVLLPALDRREKHGYTRTVVQTFTPDGKPQGKAVVYFTDVNNCPAYRGPRTKDKVAETIISATGPSGPNIDYFFSLYKFLRDHDFPDDHMDELMVMVRTKLDTRRLNKLDKKYPNCFARYPKSFPLHPTLSRDYNWTGPKSFPHDR
eukprot:gb/GEZN01010300.1/.p1 GENE.gb/GEZN01010300.1/~~gb/GEZN01010300.1/.p1  ORF type:complete len:337 (+),score=14.26 gb/GEZN01010300.1/:72-1082(+)